MLRTVRAIVDAGLPLPVHIGVSEGRVFTGQVGASFRRTYTVLGDTAALAARLMARAGEDEIWVSAGALERGGESFASTELEPLSLKGKSEPVQAFVLGELLLRPRGRSMRRPMTSCRSSIASASGRCSERPSRPCAWDSGHSSNSSASPGSASRASPRSCARTAPTCGRSRFGASSTRRRPPTTRSALPPVSARRGAQRRRGPQPHGAGRAPRSRGRGAGAVDAAPRRSARRRGRVDTRGERSRPRVLASAPARGHGDASRTSAGLADAARVRRRPLDGRRIVRAPALPRDAASGSSVARVHDSTPGGRRLRRGRGDAATSRA